MNRRDLMNSTALRADEVPTDAVDAWVAGAHRAVDDLLVYGNSAWEPLPLDIDDLRRAMTALEEGRIRIWPEPALMRYGDVAVDPFVGFSVRLPPGDGTSIWLVKWGKDRIVHEHITPERFYR